MISSAPIQEVARMADHPFRAIMYLEIWFYQLGMSRQIILVNHPTPTIGHTNQVAEARIPRSEIDRFPFQ